MASINWRIWLAATLRPGAARDGLRPRLRPFPVDASLVFIMPRSNGLEAIRVINGLRNDSELFDEDQPMRTHFNREEARPLAESASVGKTADTSRAAPKAPEDGARATPMMAQYVEIKGVNPDCLLFYRMGDFYELFFEDAEIASRALGIVLTKRGKHQGADIPMCGVPIHRSDDYLHRLIAAGFRVAVCEQTEDPADARKRGAKSVVARDVTRLITAGTLTEDSLLDARRNNYLVALVRAKASAPDAPALFALACIEISTAEFRVMECDRPGLAAEIARIEPGEIIVSDALYGDPDVAPWLRKSPLTPLTRHVFDGRTAERRLAAYFAVATTQAFGT